MKRTVLWIAIFYITLSCDRFPDPSVSSVNDYVFEFQIGQGLKFQAGDLISDNIVFKATNNSEPAKSQVKVLFDIVKGDGNITKQVALTDDNGMTSLGWKAGTGSAEQRLRANSYDLSGRYLASTDLVEYAFNNDEWDGYSGSPECYITDIAADTINKITLMAADSRIFRQGDKYYIWNEVADPALNNAKTINIDRNGIFYVSVYGGGLVKSIDHGQSWTSCTSPYSDSPYNILVRITRDNYIWVYAWNHKIRYSKDGGDTWTDSGSGLTDGFGDIFRLKDGSLLYHGSTCCSLYRSFDDAQTWTKMFSPDYSEKLFVDDDDVIHICSQHNGVLIFNSPDYGVTYNQVYSVPYDWSVSFNNTYTRWNNFYFVLIPGLGIMKSVDLIHFEMYWDNPELSSFFIDHNGVLITKDLNKNTIYYRKNSAK
jgi:hypothetical protein